MHDLLTTMPLRRT